MIVIWTPDAVQDRLGIRDYIAADSPRAASRMDVLFGNAADRLVAHPYIGREGRLSGTRELFPHKHYCLVYEVDEDAGIIWILALLHGAQQWPPQGE